MISENYNEILKEYYNFGLKSHNKKVVIFDIASNHGGNSRFPQSFIKGLNDHV